MCEAQGAQFQIRPLDATISTLYGDGSQSLIFKMNESVIGFGKILVILLLSLVK